MSELKTMTKRKAAFEANCRLVQERIKALEEQGMTDKVKQLEALRAEGVKGGAAVLNKIFKVTSRPPKSKSQPPSLSKEEEDVAKAAANAANADIDHQLKIRDTRLDAAKPIITKEVEGSAWIQGVCYDVGNHVYHSAVTREKLTGEELQDYRKAAARITRHYDALETLSEDASKLVDTEADNAELQYALKLTLKQMEKVKMFNQVLTRSLCPDCRMKVLTTFVLSLGVLPTSKEA